MILNKTLALKSKIQKESRYALAKASKAFNLILSLSSRKREMAKKHLISGKNRSRGRKKNYVPESYFLTKIIEIVPQEICFVSIKGLKNSL